MSILKIAFFAIILQNTIQNESGQNSELAEEEKQNEDEEIPESYFHPAKTLIPKVITNEYLKHNITEFHDDIMKCIDGHFTRHPRDQIALESIIDDCVGEKAEKLAYYYNDIKYLTKKFFMDEVETIMFSGVCDDDYTKCVHFFKEIQLFVEMEYNIRKSLLQNTDIMEDLIGREKLEFYEYIIHDKVEEFVDIKALLQKKQQFLVNFIKMKREQYEQDYPQKVESEEEEENEESAESEQKEDIEEENDDEEEKENDS
jgi:hypothetical protein